MNTGSQDERKETAQEILRVVSEVDVVVTTYDMTVNTKDNIFLQKLKPNVSLDSGPISSYLSKLGLRLRRGSYSKNGGVPEAPRP